MKNYEKIENEITMAEKQKQQATRTTIDELNETLSGVERRVEGNKKMIVWVVVAILVVFGIAGGFFYGSKMSKEDAKEAIGVADIARMNGQDSVAVAEYLKVSEEYGNTVGNRAALEAAVILYQQGKYAEAVAHVTDAKDQELHDICARKLVEMAGYIIMAHLLLQDATVSPDMFRDSAFVFTRYVEGEVEKNYSYVMGITSEDLAHYRK